MDEETKKRIADFFTPGELADYLWLDTMEIIEAFPDRLEELLDDLEELMQVKHG